MRLRLVVRVTEISRMDSHLEVLSCDAVLTNIQKFNQMESPDGMKSSPLTLLGFNMVRLVGETFTGGLLQLVFFSNSTVLSYIIR